MTMTLTPTDTRVALRVSGDLLVSAREALGLPEEVGTSELIRSALATVAGLDLDRHARLPMGGDVRRYRREGAAG